MSNLIDDQDPFGFMDLEDDHIPVKSTSSEKRYPCGQCAGTGTYQGARVHQVKSHCFACKGKGYFKTDPRKLERNRLRRKSRKADALKSAIEVFRDQYPVIFAELSSVHFHGSRSEFETSLANQLMTRGSLSDKQIAAYVRGKEKYRAAIAARQEAAANMPPVDLTPIREMFETAVASGYKRPKYRAEGLVLSRAPDYGRNPGALYVKNEDDEYLGKILGTTFSPTLKGQSALDLLVTISRDPLEAALRYGQRTGRCACCGRLLTAHKSIDAGIGPVCKSKWGL